MEDVHGHEEGFENKNKKVSKVNQSPSWCACDTTGWKGAGGIFLISVYRQRAAPFSKNTVNTMWRTVNDCREPKERMLGHLLGNLSEAHVLEPSTYEDHLEKQRHKTSLFTSLFRFLLQLQASIICSSIR